MQYVRFSHESKIVHGVLYGKTIRVLERSFLRNGRLTGEKVKLSSVRLLAPVMPRTVMAIGLNYADHAKESNMPIPDEPFLFLKTPGCIVSPGDPIRLVVPEHRNDYEGELVIVIKKRAHNVPAEKAHEFILGYTCGNDVSDRDYQKSDSQWMRSKGCDSYGPIGPVITDEIDPHNVRIQTRLNGEIKQDSSTTQMIFPIPRLIEHVTRYVTLLPGDVIFTGTPPGIGPMKAGDEVEVEIQGIGVLHNPVLNAEPGKYTREDAVGRASEID